jgi:hypothetical protein
MFDRKVVISLLLFLGIVPWCQGQPFREFSKWGTDVYANYSYIPNNFMINQGSVSGWDVGVDTPVNKWIDVTMDISQYRTTLDFGEHLNTLTFLFGPRIPIPVRRTSRVKPFGDFLFGGANGRQNNFFDSQKFTSSVTFAWSADGGVDYRLSRHFLLRGEGGFLYARFNTSDNQAQPYFPAGHPRISTGVVYRF